MKTMTQENLNVDLPRWFRRDPTVGVSLVDAEMRIQFVNDRAVEMFLAEGAKVEAGQSLWELFPEPWVKERQDLVRRVLETDEPLALRSIRRGVRIQSTFYPVHDEDDKPTSVLVFSVPGETAVRKEQDGMEIVESGIVDLGDLDRLTRREIEVLALMGHGMGRLEIAEKLYRSPKTVDNHMASIGGKLGVANRAELVQIATRAGLKLGHADLPRTHE